MIDALSQKAVWVFLMVASVSMVVALGAVSGGMLSAAHEMREEIGIYRAIGSRQSDIVWVFLMVASVSMVVALGAVSGGMLSAAHEMREEIGIYRAIGSRQSDIFLLFLLQASILCILGAGIGLAVAQVLCQAASYVTGYVLTVPIGLIAVCALLAVGCGILSGLAPAIHAAHLDPVKAMK